LIYRHRGPDRYCESFCFAAILSEPKGHRIGWHFARISIASGRCALGPTLNACATVHSVNRQPALRGVRSQVAVARRRIWRIWRMMSRILRGPTS
jgi:hypothetical protein